MPESPHSWPLLPGSGGMKSDKTRICKLICGRLGRGGGADEEVGSEKINGHLWGRRRVC